MYLKKLVARSVATVPTVPTIRTQLATDLATDFYFFYETMYRLISN